MEHEKPVRVMIDAATIATRVNELGKCITEDFRGRETVVVGVLKGSIIFLSDLLRQIDLPVQVDVLGVSSYGNETETSGVVRITSDLSRPVHNKHVLVVEDIVDSGLTIHFLRENLLTREPASVSVCTLLHKPARARVTVPLDYVGFKIEDKFVVGYGLDHAEMYRNLPYIGEVV